MKAFLLHVAGILFGLGGVGLVIMGVLDSSFLFMPLGNDLLVIALTARHHARMPYYAAMATLGSVAGVFLLDALSRKGGEKGLEGRVSPERLAYIKRKIEKRAGWGIAIASHTVAAVSIHTLRYCCGSAPVPAETTAWDHRRIAHGAVLGRRYARDHFRTPHYQDGRITRGSVRDRADRGHFDRGQRFLDLFVDPPKQAQRRDAGAPPQWGAGSTLIQSSGSAAPAYGRSGGQSLQVPWQQGEFGARSFLDASDIRSMLRQAFAWRHCRENRI